MEYILAQGSRHIYQKILHCSSKEKDLKSYRNIFLQVSYNASCVQNASRYAMHSRDPRILGGRCCRRFFYCLLRVEEINLYTGQPSSSTLARPPYPLSSVVASASSSLSFKSALKTFQINFVLGLLYYYHLLPSLFYLCLRFPVRPQFVLKFEDDCGN